jgi:hypothetical protein
MTCRDEGAPPEVAATGTVGKQRSGGNQMRRERAHGEDMAGGDTRRRGEDPYRVEI